MLAYSATSASSHCNIIHIAKIPKAVSGQVAPTDIRLTKALDQSNRFRLLKSIPARVACSTAAQVRVKSTTYFQDGSAQVPERRNSRRKTLVAEDQGSINHAAVVNLQGPAEGSIGFVSILFQSAALYI